MLKSRGVDVRPADFNTVLISLIKRTLYKDIEKYSKFKAKIVICFLMIIYSLKIIPKTLRYILTTNFFGEVFVLVFFLNLQDNSFSTARRHLCYATL